MKTKDNNNPCTFTKDKEVRYLCLIPRRTD